MASKANDGSGRFSWRIVGWGTAVALILLPFVAMQFTRQVSWTPADFAVFGIMLLCVAVPLELAARFIANRTYVAATAIGLLAAFLVTWANLAVGIVGSEHNPLNLLFFAALLVGIIGGALARFHAVGMSRAMMATAAALPLAFVVAVLGPSDEPNVSHLVELAGTSVFAALFLLSAWLFRRAAKA